MFHWGKGRLRVAELVSIKWEQTCIFLRRLPPLRDALEQPTDREPARWRWDCKSRWSTRHLQNEVEIFISRDPQLVELVPTEAVLGRILSQIFLPQQPLVMLRMSNVTCIERDTLSHHRIPHRRSHVQFTLFTAIWSAVWLAPVVLWSRPVFRIVSHGPSPLTCARQPVAYWSASCAGLWSCAGPASAWVAMGLTHPSGASLPG